MFSSSISSLLLLTAVLAPSHVAAFWGNSGPACTVVGASCPSFNNVDGGTGDAINGISTAHCAPDLFCGDNGAACTTDNDCWNYCGTGGVCGGVGAPCDSTNPSGHLDAVTTCFTSGGLVCNLNAQECQVGGSGVVVKKKRAPKDCEAQNMTTCPIVAAGARRSMSFGWECVDTETSLEQCGGCDELTGGVDCTAIPNVASVECRSGGCVVEACESDFTLTGGKCL